MRQIRQIYTKQHFISKVLNVQVEYFQFEYYCAFLNSISINYHRLPMSFSCMTNKTLCIESFPKNRHRFFRLSDKWYVKQMKLFNFMNCRASWMPDKLHGSLHPPPNQAYQEIKAFTEMVDEFRTKNVAQNTDYLRKIISILYIYICLE